ncbi:hypothetical protein DMX08_07075 [Pseudomonas protegens]|uniref:Uncharacterized protein n=1 Tax=Pseudomonas protegens TaxID=380021 RepID=A0A9Q6IHG1_9PSED|nr:hypothetical protein DMX08_07075 [Pseudomonas protegens]
MLGGSTGASTRACWKPCSARASLAMLERSGMTREMDGQLLFSSVRSGIRAYRIWRNSMRGKQ